MAAIIEDADLDEDQEAKLEREFKREYQLITREDRLERIGKDIVAHFMGRGALAKAMVISIDKATAVRTFDMVRKHWKGALERLREELAAADPMEKAELEQGLKFFEETDMAVVGDHSMETRHKDVNFLFVNTLPGWTHSLAFGALFFICSVLRFL